MVFILLISGIVLAVAFIVTISYVSILYKKDGNKTETNVEPNVNNAANTPERCKKTYQTSNNKKQQENRQCLQIKKPNEFVKSIIYRELLTDTESAFPVYVYSLNGDKKSQHTREANQNQNQNQTRGYDQAEYEHGLNRTQTQLPDPSPRKINIATILDAQTVKQSINHDTKSHPESTTNHKENHNGSDQKIIQDSEPQHLNYTGNNATDTRKEENKKQQLAQLDTSQIPGKKKSKNRDIDLAQHDLPCHPTQYAQGSDTTGHHNKKRVEKSNKLAGKHITQSEHTEVDYETFGECDDVPSQHDHQRKNMTMNIQVSEQIHRHRSRTTECNRDSTPTSNFESENILNGGVSAILQNASQHGELSNALLEPNDVTRTAMTGIARLAAEKGLEWMERRRALQGVGDTAAMETYVGGGNELEIAGIHHDTSRSRSQSQSRRNKSKSKSTVVKDMIKSPESNGNTANDSKISKTIPAEIKICAGLDEGSKDGNNRGTSILAALLSKQNESSLGSSVNALPKFENSKSKNNKQKNTTFENSARTSIMEGILGKEFSSRPPSVSRSPTKQMNNVFSALRMSSASPCKMDDNDWKKLLHGTATKPTGVHRRPISAPPTHGSSTLPSGVLILRDMADLKEIENSSSSSSTSKSNCVHEDGPCYCWSKHEEEIKSSRSLIKFY